MDWTEFLKLIKDKRESLGFEENEECFYRGHSDHTWNLSPGLFRNFDGSKKGEEQLITVEQWSAEADVYYEFQARAKELHDANLKDWDVLFYMQHHRVKTRLLDWSENFAAALYFAITDYTIKQPCIWMLNPYKMNKLLHGSRDLWSADNLDYYGNTKGETYSDLLLGIHKKEEGLMFYWHDPIALFPVRRNNRLTNQGGYFTIHGNYVKPLNHIKQISKCLTQVNIPLELIPDAFEFLGLAGVNDFTMFPDLDGLAKYLNKKYFKS